MALFRLPSSGPAALAPRGHGLLLRAPQMSDFLQWAHLRESSRNYLTPWEPIWPSDDLTRSGFRRRLRRYAEDIAADRSYPFHRVPGIRWRDDRRRHAGECPPRHRAGRHDRLLGRPTPCPSRLHDGGAAGAAAVAVRRAQSAPYRGRLHSRPTRRRSGCWRNAASAARVWRGAISASMASGRTTCCSACCTRIFAASLVFRTSWSSWAPWVRRHCAVITRPACAPSDGCRDDDIWGHWMMRNGWMQTASAGRRPSACRVDAGCGRPCAVRVRRRQHARQLVDSSPSIGDRFSQLFGSKSQAVGEAAPPPAADERIDLPAGEHSRRRIHLCGGGAGQAAGRQRSALSGDDHPHRARLHAERRPDHRADRHSGPRHCRPGRKSGDGRSPAARRGGAGRRPGEDHRHQGLPDHGGDDGGRQRAVQPGCRRSGVSGAARPRPATPTSSISASIRRR